MKVNEIFYSLQGEGRNAGRAAIFIRLSGCNLVCPFCDTKHKQGEAMLSKDVLDKVIEITGVRLFGINQQPLIVLTGGEPTLQDCTKLVTNLHEYGFEVAIETNGTRNPEWLKMVDFITLSPKFEFVNNADVVLNRCNELKVVYNGKNNLSRYDNIKADYYYLQPCDTGNEQENKEIINKTIEVCKCYPKWRLSLQTQKIVGIL